MPLALCFYMMLVACSSLLVVNKGRLVADQLSMIETNVMHSNTSEEILYLSQ